ncbi:hypothetical protein HYV81_01780 [Candidatus Woesearchaeota archaeon]|nr:hypothetical protein [Candidatus Woesearchaeota archaeon]
MSKTIAALSAAFSIYSLLFVGGAAQRYSNIDHASREFTQAGNIQARQQWLAYAQREYDLMQSSMALVPFNAMIWKTTAPPLFKHRTNEEQQNSDIGAIMRYVTGLRTP